MTSMKKRIAAALTAATLAIVLTIPTMAAESPDDPVRVPPTAPGNVGA